MKKFTVILIAAMICSMSFSQNYHSVYTSATTDNFQSLVNMSKPPASTSGTWFVATDDANKVIVMEMDWNYPNPQPQNIWAFQLLSAAGIGQVYLRSGFFDSEGNIFVYGYESADNKGIYAKINFANGIPSSLCWASINKSNSQIMDACWAPSHDLSQSTINYGIIFNDAYNESHFARVVGNTAGTFAITNNVIRTTYYSKSVSYASDKDVFVISGYFDYGNAPMMLTTVSNTAQLSGQTIRVKPVGIVNNSDTTPPDFFLEKTHKHVPSGENDGTVYLVQEIVETHDSYDDADYNNGLWISKMNYLTETVIWSHIYSFPTQFAKVIDVAVGYGYLYVLGYIDDLQTGYPRFLAQIDTAPNSQNNFIVKSMTDVNSWTLPQYYLEQQMYLSSLNYNEATYNVYASGAMANGNAYLVEAADMFYDYCDIGVPVYMPYFNYTNNPTVFLFTQAPALIMSTKRLSTPTSYLLPTSN
jgi:hypothetical protein